MRTRFHFTVGFVVKVDHSIHSEVQTASGHSQSWIAFTLYCLSSSHNSLTVGHPEHFLHVRSVQIRLVDEVLEIYGLEVDGLLISHGGAVDLPPLPLVHAGVAHLVLRAGHGLLPGQGRDGVSDQMGAGGSAGQGGGVGARVTAS